MAVETALAHHVTKVGEEIARERAQAGGTMYALILQREKACGSVFATLASAFCVRDRRPVA